MAKIPLRVYLKEIENLIERGEIEQAVAHAKNILRAYPKHLETYRLLGKAYLESQRYSEASDILQRVLSVTPDDFISQIGMSIIREDEGNMDASIWHMERAYEVQPFNPAVQDELRRLYGRRDGVEPPKIRLTRGALVRMYARGELYPQAIAETRAALAEDPQRLDLRVLLARLYYLLGQKNDAAEVCSELISKLPYCYEANRLLAEILPTTSRASETPKFQQRIFALDPYEAFISPSAPTSQQVPDQAVMVEQFSWEQAVEGSQSPDWARSVGVEWEEQPEENLPDWLNTLKPEAPAAEVHAGPAAPIAEPAEPEADLVPDWMKEAGWAPTDRTADEIMAEQQISADTGMGERISDEEAAERAEIPDWLQSMVPPDAAPSPEVEQERSEWLENILSESQPGDQASLSGGETVSFEELPAETVPPVVEPSTEEEVAMPDWMAGFGTEIEPVPGEAETLAQEPEGKETEEPLPDWLMQLQSTEEAPAAPSGEETPTDLGELDIWAQEVESPQPSETLPAGEESPDWLKEFQSKSENEPLVSGGMETQDFASLEQPVEPAASQETPDQQTPEGLSDVSSTAGPELSTGETQDFATPLETRQEGLDQEIPEWLSDVSSIAGAELPTSETQDFASPQEPAVEQPIEAQPAAMPDMADTDAMMAWLESLAARQGADEATLITSPEDRTETPPDWVMKEMESAGPEEITQPVQTLHPQQPEETPLEVEQPLEEEIPGAGPETVEASLEAEPTAETQPAPDLSSEDAAFAWLESLAAGQGADEATLSTSPEERPSAPPEWITQEFQEQAAAENIAEEAEEMEESAVQPPAAEEQMLTEETAELPEIEELPSWLKEEPLEPAAETPMAPAEAQAAPDLTDMDAAMAWLESLAARQGADEETLTTTPEQRSEVPPDWVLRETENALNAPEAELEAPVEEPPAAVEPVEPTVSEPEPSMLETGAVEIEAPAEEEQASPEWLKGLEEEEIAEHFAEEQALPWSAEVDQAAAPAEPLPDWMKTIESEQPASVAGEGEKIPDWLLGLEDEGELESISPQEAPPAETGDYRSAWAPTETGWETELPTEGEQPLEAEPLSAAMEEPVTKAPQVEPESITFEAAAAPVIEEQAWQAPSGDGDLETARAALNHGQLEQALNSYNRLIENEESLNDIIRDLRDALYRYPVDIDLWQALGDACMHNNQLQEALDAYTKAEELLR